MPYANAATNPNLAASPSINVGFNSSVRYTPFTMDTGSVGIVATRDAFQPAPEAQNLGLGQQYFSSSGNIENGTWWSSKESIYDASGKLVATADVPVLQVTSRACAPNARSCRPSKHPTGVALMGIGFARESPQQPRGIPAYNAFLNLTSVATPRRAAAATGRLAQWLRGHRERRLSRPRRCQHPACRLRQIAAEPCLFHADFARVDARADDRVS